MMSTTFQPEGSSRDSDLCTVPTRTQNPLVPDVQCPAAGGDAEDEARAFHMSGSKGDAHSPYTSSQDVSLQPPPPSHTPQSPSRKKSVAEGMRREWRFALQFVHQAGQLCIQCSPQWEYGFIEVEQTAVGLAQSDRSPLQVDSTPMLAVLSYTDRTAVVKSSPKPLSRTSSSPGGGAPSRWTGDSRQSLATSSAEVKGNPLHAARPSFTDSHPVGESAAAAAADHIDSDAWWVEHSKKVELFYCHPPPGMNLKHFCKYCVQFILRDTRVSSVDGDRRLKRLRIGNKLRCQHRLGGHHRSFQFRYTLHDRAELQETYVYVIGCITGKRAYMLRAQCTDAEELEGYVRTLLLPVYVTPGRAQFGVELTYRYVPPTGLLGVQQEAFGELQYIDQKAAIVFVIPLYPMRVLLDYSPAKTVGVGSITCVTLELSLHEQLLDDTLAAEITGVSKYKVITLIMCIEVEEVSRMGYPKVMSTEKYSELKAARVAEVFPDAHIVGLPTNRLMGNRTGRMRTMTFTHEPFGCMVKALITSTLVGNFGVTALYLTKPGSGAFDSHLYVFQQLLNGIDYLPQNSFAMSERVSRYRARNIRLVKEDIIHAYSTDSHCSDATSPTTRCATKGSSSSMPTSAEARPYSAMFASRDARVVAATRERHLHFLSLCDDGRVQDSVEALVSLEEGGVLSNHRSTSIANMNNSLHAHSVYRAAADADGAAACHTGAAQEPPLAASAFAGSSTSDAFAMGTPLRCALTSSEKAVSSLDEETYSKSDADLSSLVHSSSRISVNDIHHLLGSTSASVEDDSSGGEEAMCVAVDENQDASLCDSSGMKSAPSASAVSLSPTRQPAPQNSDIGDSVGDRAIVCRPSESSSGAMSIPFRVADTTRGPEDTGLPVQLISGTASAVSTMKPHDMIDSIGDMDTPAHSLDAATGRTVTPRPADDKDDSSVAARQEQQRLYEELIGKGDPAVQQALREAEGGTLYGPSLRDVYARCCEAQQCRPNSYLMHKLPVQPEFIYSVEEIDLSANYVGHNGFVAVLHLLEHLPRLRVVYFNNMSLDNTDAESLCYVLATNLTVCEVYLEQNPGISLPAVRHFTALLRVNKRIEVLSLAGTRLSPTLIAKLHAETNHRRV